MVRRIIYALLLLGVIAVCYVVYSSWHARRSMLSGDVVSGPSDPLPSDPASVSPRQAVETVKQKFFPPPKTSAASQAGDLPAEAPASDSQSPDAPDGARFASTNRFEVYRQGNLTYRIDTGSGKSCVLYATKEEWRKPEVYRNGCGNSAAQ